MSKVMGAVAKGSTSRDASSSDGGWSVQTFVLETLDMVGAVVELNDWGVYNVLLPKEEMKRITFHPEIAQERDDCELVTFGTPFFESMLEVAKSRGRLQVRRIETKAEKPQNTDAKLVNLVHFVKCKPPKTHRSWLEENLLLLCRFLVTYQADEVEEDVVTALVDLHTLVDITHLVPALDNHWFTVGPEESTADGHSMTRHENLADDNGVPRPVPTPYTLEVGFERASEIIRPEIERRIARIQAQNRLQLEDELAKSRHYYATTLGKLKKQLQSTVDATRRQRIGEKIEATQRDRDLRMEDISRAYNVTVDARLDSAILYRVPVAPVEAHVQQRTDVFPYVFRYYPWASAWSPVTCPVCRKSASSLERGAECWHCGCEG